MSSPASQRSRARRWALRSVLGALVVAAGAVALAPPATAATFTEVTNFGANPTNLRMHLYVPDNLPTRPAVLVAIHYCTGSGPAFYSGTEFANLANQYGFLVIYPSATRSGQCFDVSTPGALSRNGNSDPAGIISMVNYVLSTYNADPDRVFVTGASSGAMMTNVLLGLYPDVFRAGAAFMGVPFGCFATTDGSLWNSACANGQISRTPQQWGDLVRAAYPGYTGPRPRVQLFHGTNDNVLHFNNFNEAIKQWTNVLGVSQTPAFTDSPQTGWTRTRYGGTGTQAPVEAIRIEGGGHDLPRAGQALMAIRFFGLDSGSGPTTPPPPPPPAGCRVDYQVNAWNTGLTTSITITNTGSSTINGWSLVFTLPSGQTITSGWNATYTPSSGQVTATNMSYNAAIQPGASTNIGFQATHTGDSGRPASFTLNGALCTVA
jgi:poly(hydroxyalkanoate) depolymerase family esterase